MKKTILTLFSLALFCMTSYAQEAQGCDGSRYLAGGVFEDFTMTTVTYGQNQSVTGNTVVLEMDIYEPVGDAVEKRPAVVLAHGGTFIVGNKGDLAELAADYARMGYVAVSINYRLFPFFELGLPNATQMVDEVVKAVTDMKAAVRFLRKDADTDNLYKIDPDYIFVGGLSAGGVAAMHVAQLGLDDEIPENVQEAVDNNGGLEGTTGNEGYSSVPQAVINMSGGLNDANWIDADDVPFISFHGDSDGTVPFLGGLAAGIVYLDGSGNCHPVADAVGVNNLLVTVPGGDHTDIYTQAQFETERVDFAINGNLFLHNLLCSNTVDTDDLLDAEISVFPNPSVDKVTIDLGTIDSMYDIIVYNQVGQVVYKSYSNNNQQFILSKDAVGAGFFVAEIRVMDNGVKSLTRKIIFE